MKSFDCIVIGDVLIDIIMQASENYGQVCRGGISYCNSGKTVFGGGGNIAAGVSIIGGNSVFVGKAGQDFFEKLYVQDLKNIGVFTRIFLDKNLPTGLVVVFVDNGNQRSFLVFRGANDQLLVEEIEKVTNLIKKSKFLYFSGFSIINTPQRKAIFRAIELAKKFKKKVVFDPGAYNLIKSEKDLFDNMLDICDVFSPNLEEARAITNVFNINDIICELKKRVPLTFLKCDKGGSIIITKNDVIKIPNYSVNCIDPTGAGDAFTAGVLFGLSQELPLESIGQLANWFSSEVVTNIGPRSFPEKSKILQFLKELRGYNPN